MNSNNSLVEQTTIQSWADIVIKEWIKKVDALGIKGDALVNSFINHVIWSAGGNLQRVAFAFEYYGKFIDMGVGKGVNRHNRDALINVGLTKRRPKPWFTNTFYKQVAVLKHIISEKVATNTQLMIVRKVTENRDGAVIEL